MSASDEIGLPSEFDGEEVAEVRWPRFFLATIAFLAYETAFLLILRGDLWWAAGDREELIFILLISGAALGYFLYGAFVDSFAMGFAVLLPIVIAMALDGTANSDDGRGEALPLYVAWLFYSVFFLPAWFIGLLAGLAIRGNGRRPS
jgi:hypothetical protein